MGCDIHFYVERQLTDSTWVVVPPPKHDPIRWPQRTRDVDEQYIKTFEDWWGPDECMHTYTCEACEGVSCIRCAGTGRDLNWWRSRNYALFGVLAHVRRKDFPPIAQPRGLPVDISAALKASELLREDDRSDIHSHSWLTLDEVLRFDWGAWTAYHNHFIAFHRFLEEIVKPEIGGEYPELRAVLADLLEERRQGKIIDDKPLREQMRAIEKTWRFVFGFDN
jgi:hypothetical protein